MGNTLIKRNPIHWSIFLTVVILGVIITSFFIGRSMILRFSPLINASHEIRYEATMAHLWLEEILSGDREVNIESIWEHLDRAEWYAQAMLTAIYIEALPDRL